MIGALVEGRYSVLKKLDEGPGRAVYLVEDQKEKRSRRVLTLLAPLEEDPARERKRGALGRALEQLAKAQHQNLAKVHDHGFTQARGFLVTEHVDGPDLFRFASRASWSGILEVVV